MKNPLDKLKKKKVEDTESGKDSMDSGNKENSEKNISNERRKAFNEKPMVDNNSSNDSSSDIKFKHLIETELNVIQKKAKALSLNTEDGFDEKSGENYWRVSVNEFLGYVNQRSKIIIEQLSGDSHPVNIKIDEEKLGD